VLSLGGWGTIVEGGGRGRNEFPANHPLQLNSRESGGVFLQKLRIEKERNSSN